MAVVSLLTVTLLIDMKCAPIPLFLPHIVHMTPQRELLLTDCRISPQPCARRPARRRRSLFCSSIRASLTGSRQRSSGQITSTRSWALQHQQVTSAFNLKKRSKKKRCFINEIPGGNNPRWFYVTITNFGERGKAITYVCF